eukprot:sb/3478480/
MRSGSAHCSRSARLETPMDHNLQSTYSTGVVSMLACYESGADIVDVAMDAMSGIAEDTVFSKASANLFDLVPLYRCILLIHVRCHITAQSWSSNGISSQS